MGDSEQEPVFSPFTREGESRSWIPMVAGAALLLVVVAGMILLTRSGRPAPANPGDPNLAKLQIANLHMATAQNFAGGSVTYIEGKITNTTDRRVTGASVQVLFKNSLG